MKNIIRIIGMLLIALYSMSVQAQKATKAEKNAANAAKLKRMIESKSYIFKANQAFPMGGGGAINVIGSNMGGGGVINLTSNNYDLKLSNDTLTAFLPYFGVSYTAPLNPTDGGIKFTTTKFDYKVVQKKNGNYEINFKPKNLNPRTSEDIVNMFLTVSGAGYATLQTISLNRQGISFSGWLEEVKPKPAS